MLTAIVPDVGAARGLLEAEPPPDLAVALTPAARLALAGASFPVMEARAHYAAYGHRRTAAAIRRTLRQAESICAAEAVPVTARETILGRLSLATGCAARLWFTLPGAGPFLVPGQSGWQVVGKAEAAALLLPALANQPAPGGRPAAAWLFRLVSRLAARLAGRKAGGLMLGTFDRGFAPLSRRLAATGTVLSLRMARGNWRDWGVLALGLRAALAGRGTVQLAAMPSGGFDYSALLDRIAAAQPAWLAAGLAPFTAAIARDAALAQGMVADAAGLLKAAQVRTLYSYSMRWLGDAAQAEAAGRVGARRVLLSHGSHPAPAEAVAAFAHSDLARGLLVSPLADVAAVQSPSADALAARLMPQLPRLPVRPLIWGFTACTTPPPTCPPLRLLQAGTFKDWSAHRPWIYETSDEYLHGIATLATAVAQVDGVELVVRARPTRECPIEAVHSAVHGCANVTVKTGGAFLDDLATAHVLVSYSSTTIEEALAARRPVLLWGGASRYRHLPARTLAPAAGDRAAIYAAPDEAALSPLIRALAQAHAAGWLSDDERAGLVWQPEAVGWEALGGCGSQGRRV